MNANLGRRKGRAHVAVDAPTFVDMNQLPIRNYLDSSRSPVTAFDPQQAPQPPAAQDKKIDVFTTLIARDTSYSSQLKS